MIGHHTIVATLVAVSIALARTRCDATDDPLDARAIMERVNARPRPSASARRMSLFIERDGGRRVDREIVAYQADDGVHTKTIFSVVAPDDMKGLGILRWEGPGEDALWLQIEGLPQPARPAEFDPGLPFWGTEFTLGDVGERFRLDAYAFQRLGTGTVAGRPCLIIGATVADPRLGYRRVIGWIDTERWLVLKAKYRDVHGHPLKLFLAGNVRNVTGYWLPHRFAMRSITRRRTTTFDVTAAEILPSLPEDLLIPTALVAGRARCYPRPCPIDRESTERSTRPGS